VARPVLPGLLIGAGGVLSLLGGLVAIGTGGFEGLAGVVTGGVIVLVGVLVTLWPSRNVVFAYLTYALVVPTVLFSYSGFIVGIFLLILGATLTLVWVPPGPNRTSG
jgi:hypothetical protein